MKKYLKIFVLILLLSTSRIKGVKAESFYEDNWISGVYANLVDGDFSKPQQMRFIRRKSDNKASYCLTPRFLLYDDQVYNRYDINQQDISEAKLKRINKIAYFGYGYQNHNDDYWYAITQIMIWKEMEPNMDIFFTDSYRGNRITRFENEMEEINNLINEYDKLPSFHGLELIADNNYEFVDPNTAIKNYELYSDEGIETSKDDDILTIKTKDTGNYRITFYKDDNLYYENPYVYKASMGQDIFVQGTIGGMSYSFNVKVNNNELQVTKQDAETLEYIGGVTYGVYDEREVYIGEITTDKNGIGKIDHLDSRLYKLKEKKVPFGYQLDDNFHEIYINEGTNYITLYNNKIKVNVTLFKYISDDSVLSPEKDVEFEIYDDKNKLISSISTDNNGSAITKLPYGKYRIHQVTSKEGYDKVKDFTININNEEDQVYYLTDNKTKEKSPDKESTKEDPEEESDNQSEEKINKEVNNPKTSDVKIYIYIIAVYVSFIGLLYVIASIKQKD